MFIMYIRLFGKDIKYCHIDFVSDLERVPFAKHVCYYFCIVHVGFELSSSLITLFEKRLFLLLVMSSIFMLSAFVHASCMGCV